MPVSGLRPKEQLPKGYLDYALFLQVPYGSADEFGLSSESKIEQGLTILPQTDNFETFSPDENPVAFVMNQLSAIYPPIYQASFSRRAQNSLVKLKSLNLLQCLPQEAESYVIYVYHYTHRYAHVCLYTCVYSLFIALPLS